jgi:acyl phosphate:glycerol-3-phosphate acyltransferase
MISHWLLAGAGGYLLGSFPSAVLAGKLWGKGDPRRLGTGNPGALNSLRSMGAGPGIAVFVADIGKGMAAAALAVLFLGWDYGWLAGLAALIGHVFPLFAGFRGGKGLATSCGALVIMDLRMLAVFLLVWGLVFAWRRKVAPASVVALSADAIYVLIVLPLWPQIVSLAGLALIFWRHWPDARRDMFVKG